MLETLWRATEIDLDDAVETRPFEGVYNAVPPRSRICLFPLPTSSIVRSVFGIAPGDSLVMRLNIMRALINCGLAHSLHEDAVCVRNLPAGS